MRGKTVWHTLHIFLKVRGARASAAVRGPPPGKRAFGEYEKKEASLCKMTRTNMAGGGSSSSSGHGVSMGAGAATGSDLAADRRFGIMGSCRGSGMAADRLLGMSMGSGTGTGSDEAAGSGMATSLHSGSTSSLTHDTGMRSGPTSSLTHTAVSAPGVDVGIIIVDDSDDNGASPERVSKRSKRNPEDCRDTPD